MSELTPEEQKRILAGKSVPKFRDGRITYGDCLRNPRDPIPVKFPQAVYPTSSYMPSGIFMWLAIMMIVAVVGLVVYGFLGEMDKRARMDPNEVIMLELGR